MSLAGRAAPARADRIQAFDVARGSAMLLVFLSHFSLRYLKVASGLRWHAAQGWVTLGATPAFVLVSGMMLGLLRTARADFTRMRDKLIDRGLFLLIVARPLIAIAHIALVKDWQQAFIDIVYITDTVGVSLILGALIAERVGDWGRLWLGLAVLATSWTANIAWSPDFPGGQLVEELLFGRLQGDSLLSNFPLLPWFGWYLIGSGVGALVVRAHADGAGRAAARVLFRAAAVSAVVAAIAKAAESPLRLASSDLMTAVGRTASLMSVREKLPPGVTYLALYGALSALGVGMVLRWGDRIGASSRPATAIWRALAMLGRNSLLAFVLQFYVYSAVHLLPKPPAWTAPAYFALTVAVLWAAIAACDRLRLNRMFSVGFARLAHARRQRALPLGRLVTPVPAQPGLPPPREPGSPGAAAERR